MNPTFTELVAAFIALDTTYPTKPPEVARILERIVWRLDLGLDAASKVVSPDPEGTERWRKYRESTTGAAKRDLHA